VALRSNRTLKALNLDQNRIDEDGHREFAEIFYSCDVIVLERLRGINLSSYGHLLFLHPPTGSLSNDEILRMMREIRNEM